MEVIMVCPANVATGGTESIHKFANELSKSLPVRIMYVNSKYYNPQPPEYAMYNCRYITRLPSQFNDVIILPEIWGNQILSDTYKNCIKVINWAGVDVYAWHNPGQKYGLFLKDKSVIHLAQSSYAEHYLSSLGIPDEQVLKLSDVLNDAFFEKYEEQERKNIILYNADKFKLTQFQRDVMAEAERHGMQFRGIKGLSRTDLIQLLRTSKLYIDFGVFSGRERIPRESAMCGCCVITSNLGAASYYDDVAIPDKYKFSHDSNNIPDIINLMRHILDNYEEHVADFDSYRESLINDRNSLPEQCRIIAQYLLEKRYEISSV